MTRKLFAMGIVGCLALAAGCKRSSVDDAASSTEKSPGQGASAPASSAEDAPDSGEAAHDAAPGHHDEITLGTVTIGDMAVELAQGHGKVEAGKECHLVVKLPYNDKGATVVRAWIGTEDRTASYVGRGEYAPDHDDYDLHAIAPDPLPTNVMWWIEVEKPDGTTAVGSQKPLMD